MYKRQLVDQVDAEVTVIQPVLAGFDGARVDDLRRQPLRLCLLYTSDAADERSSVDLGGRRIIKKKKKKKRGTSRTKTTA